MVAAVVPVRLRAPSVDPDLSVVLATSGGSGGPVTGASRGRTGRHLHATQHSLDTGAGKSTTARG